MGACVLDPISGPPTQSPFTSLVHSSSIAGMTIDDKGSQPHHSLGNCPWLKGATSAENA